VRGIVPLDLPVRSLIDVAWQAYTEWADEKQMDVITQAIAEHDARLTRATVAETGRPWWWDESTVDADAAAFQAAFR
jgi:hypothetical protein